MDMQWTVYVQQHGSADRVSLATFGRPLETATASDFGLSMREGRELLVALQSAVAQDQIVAYDLHRRYCRHCTSYRRIKDWRVRVFATGLGEIHVRVPRVISCLCMCCRRFILLAKEAVKTPGTVAAMAMKLH